MNTMNPYRRRYTKTADRKTIRLILNIARAVLIVLTAAVLILTMFLSLNVGKERGNGVFGTKYFVISDAMMEPAYESGIIVGVREAAAYYAGDVIAFKSSSPDNYGSVTVRIIRSETVHNDRAAFVTYSNATGVDDLSPAYAGDILGRVTSSHPALGAFYSFLRSAGGYMVWCSCRSCCSSCAKYCASSCLSLRMRPPPKNKCRHSRRPRLTVPQTPTVRA